MMKWLEFALTDTAGPGPIVIDMPYLLGLLSLRMPKQGLIVSVNFSYILYKYQKPAEHS